jgi:hypothetical protein
MFIGDGKAVYPGCPRWQGHASSIRGERELVAWQYTYSLDPITANSVVAMTAGFHDCQEKRIFAILS